MKRLIFVNVILNQYMRLRISDTLKVLHFSTFDEEGGAARAASRLHGGLRALEYESWMAVRKKIGKDSHTFVCGGAGYLNRALGVLRPYIDTAPLKLYTKKQNTPWYMAWLPNRIDSAITQIVPDVIHCHWIANGYLSVSNLKSISSKFIWTLHDSWPFTGGCHVTQECELYRSRCGRCPQLGSQRNNDLSSFVQSCKNELYQKNTPIFIAPSSWMAERARSSFLLADADIRTIPNGLDAKIFYPIDKISSRNKLNLPLNKKIILFGAMSAASDPNKGFLKLKDALHYFKELKSDEDIELLIFGADKPKNEDHFGFNARYLGRVHDDSLLSLIYSSADVMCVPSIQESFGQVATEAMACGLPVVAFRTSGLLDIVDHGVTGYLAKPYDVFDFAKGIEFVLSDKKRHEIMSENSRKKVLERFEISSVVRKHLDLYEEVIQTQKC